jgi:hypothetical protein
MANNELDPQQFLESLTTKSENPMIQGLAGTIALLEDQTIITDALVDTVEARDIEASAVQKRWSPQIRSLEINQRAAEENIKEAQERVGRAAIRGFNDHSLSNEELIYVDSLFGVKDHQSNGPTTLRYDYAASQVDKLRQFVPGAPFLSCSFSDSFGSQPAPVSRVLLHHAGVLSAVPTVRLPEDTLPWHLNPQLDLAFKDGSNLAHSWSYRSAIGKEQVEQLVSVWADEHQLGDRRDSNLWEVDETLEVLALLAPLKLTLANVVSLRTEALSRITPDLFKERGDISRLLANIRAVGGHKLFIKNVKLAAKNSQLDALELTEAVAKALRPDYGDLPPIERYSALREATTTLASI